MSTMRVAAVQAEPVWNDLQGSVDKTIRLIGEAASKGADLVGFPEVFIPGYPWSMWSKAPADNSAYMDAYFHNSLARRSPEMDRICAAARAAGIFVVLGYSERDRGSLYIAQAYIDASGTMVHHRRKLKPTHVERAYWGDGQADSLTMVVPASMPGGAATTTINIGALNCWEHTQPLLRYCEYAQDVDVHVASWPAVWPLPVAVAVAVAASDDGDDTGPPPLPGWLYHITPQMSRGLSQIMAVEGACFVLVCSQVLSPASVAAANVDGFVYATAPGGGFSMIFGPDGAELCAPLPPGAEGLLVADVDLHRKALAKQNLDVVGHYARPDLLSLRVTKEAATVVHYM